jgi:hypothetical protein
MSDVVNLTFSESEARHLQTLRTCAAISEAAAASVYTLQVCIGRPGVSAGVLSALAEMGLVRSKVFRRNGAQFTGYWLTDAGFIAERELPR